MKYLILALLLPGCAIAGGAVYSTGDMYQCPRELLIGVQKKLEALCPSQKQDEKTPSTKE